MMAQQQSDILDLYKEQLSSDLIKALTRKRERILKKEEPKLKDQQIEENPVMIFTKRIYTTKENRKYCLYQNFTKHLMEYDYWGIISDGDGKNAEPIDPNNAIFLFHLDEFQNLTEIEWREDLLFKETQ